ncbi:cytochrome P450 [Cokeromyces recurvatus]|uniref:cytochrome P450 n=1 Tax=Cokeromyces recurvatus TaxID=90255 RepID=UPI00221E812D|nr:cytochrome P450 [Cokeromyces recurvatus]KAI7905914.1 cytochrome P450 [Cokeromyces recurvatus]
MCLLLIAFFGDNYNIKECRGWKTTKVLSATRPLFLVVQKELIIDVGNTQQRLYLDPVNRIPGPKVGWFPLMGNYLEIIKNESGEPHKYWAKQYGGIFVYHGPWNSPRVVVTDDVLLKQVLTSQEYDFIKTPEASKFLRRFLGDGLLTAEGEVHRHQRKMLNPAFSVNAIRALVPLMAIPGRMLRDKWLNMINQLDKNGNGINKKRVIVDEDNERKEEFTEIEISNDLSLATLDVIGWAFGQDFKSLEFSGTPQQSKLSQAYLHIFSQDTSIMRILSFIFPILNNFPTERNKKIRRDLKWLDEESKALVQAGIDRAASAAANPDMKQNQPKDLLATMVDLIDEETGKGFTLEEMRNQCLTFMAAGHETTSVSLSWCLWLLAKNQKVQDELRAEINTLFTDDKDETIPTYDEINSLPLLNNVVRETLRLIPPVPTTTRITRVPVTLGSYVLPKGTRVFLSPITNHHSIEIWGDDAEAFNPYRWEKQEKIGNAYQYIPFLAGGRQCIGYRFALIEFKILLALLIKHIQYFEKPGFKVTKKQHVTLRPSPNMILWMKQI